MPGATALGRVSRYDFFAILGSGAYVAGSFALSVVALLKLSPDPSPLGTVKWLSGAMEKHWSLAAGSLFLAFLVGNVLRALPVNLVDNLSTKWFAILKKADDYHAALWREPFPYGEMLELELKALKQNGLGLNFAIPPEGTRHSMFNFWKAELCRESAAAFEFTQELEGRVRLFATMFWAALLGISAAAITFLLSLFGTLGPDWKLVGGAILALSAAICVVFGSQLRRVRGQEVAGVFLAYSGLTLKESKRLKRGPIHGLPDLPSRSGQRVGP
jgi:hypothetical protein